MIEITSLTKIYPGGVEALRGVDLEIEAGMFGLVGPNGAGKTSLMRIVAGLIKASRGRVTVFGHDVATLRGRLAARTLLGYLPQELGLYPNLSAREFLDYIARLKGLTEGRRRSREIETALESVRLTDVADRRLKTYSGGLKRRVGVAQAILGQPRLIIVDEPTVGLDPEERVRLRNLLADLATRCTVILSSHIIEDIGQSCNELAAITAGQVRFRGSPRDLITAARGKVWTVRTSGQRPQGEVAIVSSIQLAEGTQYRLVGQPSAHHQATAVEPTLEDSYLWLMRDQDSATTLRAA